MTQEEKKLETKKQLSKSLKKKLLQKPLDKISVTELIEDCNLNRKTFYNHFYDIYDLLNWSLEQETIEVLNQFDLLVDFEDALLYIMNYVEKNEHLINCTLDSIGITQVKMFFINDFKPLIEKWLDEISEEHNIKVSKDFYDFLATSLTSTIAGALYAWTINMKKLKKEKIISYITLILESSIPAIIEKLDESNI